LCGVGVRRNRSAGVILGPGPVPCLPLRLFYLHSSSRGRRVKLRSFFRGPSRDDQIFGLGLQKKIWSLGESDLSIYKAGVQINGPLKIGPSLLALRIAPAAPPP